jgi:coiled-coil domain-containing protein 130
MSSLAAVQADGYYIDPNKFHHKKRGRDSANAIANSNPLGARGKRFQTEGILVVRFEMPFNVWCNGCGRHVAKGVRFNANKKANGKYLSTILYEFSMKCSTCSNTFIIQTDPKNADYLVIEGCKRQTEGTDLDSTDFITTESVDTLKERKERMKIDPLFKLEYDTENKIKAAVENDRLIAIADTQEIRYGSDRLLANGAARSVLRHSMNEKTIRQLQGAALGLQDIELLPPIEQDYKLASEVMVKRKMEKVKDNEKEEKEKSVDDDTKKKTFLSTTSLSSTSTLLLSESIFASSKVKKDSITLTREREKPMIKLMTTLSTKLKPTSCSLGTRGLTKDAFPLSSPSIASIIRDGLNQSKQEKMAVVKRIEEISSFGRRGEGKDGNEREKRRDNKFQTLGVSRGLGLSLSFVGKK